MLRDGHRDIEDIGLLESISAQEGRVHLSCDRHDRNRVHERRRDPRNQIRGPRPRSRDADPDLPRRPRITIGCMRSVLLMRHEHLVDLFVIVKCVIQRQDHAAWIAEYGINALLLEAGRYCLCSLQTIAS